MRAASHLLVKIDQLPPEPGEDEDPDPTLFGIILVEWLAQVLTVRGRTIERNLPEDLGQPIRVRVSKYNLMVAVSSADDIGAEWRVSCSTDAGMPAEPEGSSPELAAQVRDLFNELRTIISADPRFRDLRCEN
jgi:hypothetical protein